MRRKLALCQDTSFFRVLMLHSPTIPIRWTDEIWRFLGKLRFNGAFIYGVKFGIAGILAVFISLLNKSQQPTWALFTVFVLMSAQYIGAIAEKSFLRMVGTVVGGVLGYLLTAMFEQEPLIYLSLLALLVGFCAAMFGQNRYPYAFLLVALTACVVSSNGMHNPQNSYVFMIQRIQEVWIGIIAVILVQSLIWPRYASAEFLQKLRNAFASLRDILATTDAVSANRKTEAQSALAVDLVSIQQLLKFGALESLHFQARLDIHVQFLDCARQIASSLAARHIDIPQNLYYRQTKDQFDSLHECLLNALDELAKRNSSPASRAARKNEIDLHLKKILTTIMDLRTDSQTHETPVEESIIFGAYVLSIQEIKDSIFQSFDLLDALENKPTPPKHKPWHFLPEVPSIFWLSHGLRTAGAVVCAMILLNSFHPPGGSMIVVASFVFCFFMPLAPEGRGDHRSYHFFLEATGLLLLLSLLLIATTPMLSIYAILNLVLFTCLFVYGYLSFRVVGLTSIMNAAMLALVGILALNAQEPVNFQKIVNFFFGISLGMLIATLFQRTLWPILPQMELHRRFLEWLKILTTAMSNGRMTPQQKCRLILLPSEIQARLPHLSPPVFPSSETSHLQNMADCLERLGSNKIWDSNLSDSVPSHESEQASKLTQNISDQMILAFHQLQAHFEKEDLPLDGISTLDSSIYALETWVSTLRLKLMSENQDPLVVCRILGIAGRWKNAASDLAEAIKIAKNLHPTTYTRDLSL